MKKYLLVFASLSVLLMSACNPADLVAGAVKNNAANAIKAGTANGAVGTEIVTKAQFLKYVECIVSKSPESKAMLSMYVTQINAIPDAQWNVAGANIVSSMQKVQASLGCSF
ncbi:MAG: hypothetical protein AABZ74_01190 [Cyanobacteriota bacterium]